MAEQNFGDAASRLDKNIASLAHSIPETVGNMSMVGHKTCSDCRTRPSHVLQPCQHKVCARHIAAAAKDETLALSICAICHQSIIATSQTPPGSSLPPKPSFLPTNPVQQTAFTGQLQKPSFTTPGPWAPVSLTAAAPSTAPVVNKAAALPASMQPHNFGHPGFMPETPAMQPAFMRAPLPVRLSDKAAVHNVSVPTHHARHSSAAAFAAPQQSLHNPVANHHNNHMLQSNAAASHDWRKPTVGRSPHYLTEDPFVDARRDIQGPIVPANSKSAALARLIKSGVMDDGSKPQQEQHGTRNRRETGRTNAPVVQDISPARAVPPAVRHWGGLMIEALPMPPFMKQSRLGGTPTFEEALEWQPFVQPSQTMKAPQHGVIVVKNIPYACTKPEIIAAIGRNCRIVSQPVGSPFYGIHIMMERSTGKTMDCYVEVEDRYEAQGIVHNWRARSDRGRAPRVGDRHVEVEVSSQEALMEQMFPKTRCVEWNGAIPKVFTTDEAYSSGFTGFITTEECAMIIKHAESPQRSPFIARALNRAYESIISIMYKYPWHKPELVTLFERSLIFKTGFGMLKTLIKAIANNVNPLQLSRLLLQELLCAMLTAPFGHKQKNDVVDLAENHGYGDLIASIGYSRMPDHSASWPFEVFDKRIGVRPEVVEYYASLFHQGSTVRLGSLSIEEMAEISANPFGALRVHYTEDDARKLSVHAASRSEWEAIDKTLRKALPSRSPLRQIEDSASIAARRSRSDTSSSLSFHSSAAGLGSPAPINAAKRHGATIYQKTSYDKIHPGDPGASEELKKAMAASRAVVPFDPAPGAHLAKGPMNKAKSPRMGTIKEASHEHSSAKPVDSGESSPVDPAKAFGPPPIYFPGLGATPARATKPSPGDGVKLAMDPRTSKVFSPLTLNGQFGSVQQQQPKNFFAIAAAKGIKVSSPVGTGFDEQRSSVAEGAAKL